MHGVKKNIASYWYDCAEWGAARDNKAWKYQVEVIVCHIQGSIQFNRFWLFDNKEDFTMFKLTWG